MANILGQKYTVRPSVLPLGPQNLLRKTREAKQPEPHLPEMVVKIKLTKVFKGYKVFHLLKEKGKIQTADDLQANLKGHPHSRFKTFDLQANLHGYPHSRVKTFPIILFDTVTHSLATSKSQALMTSLVILTSKFQLEFVSIYWISCTAASKADVSSLKFLFPSSFSLFLSTFQSS